MRVCTPHCGLDGETTSGGETYERELLRRLGGLGVTLDIILARHKRVPEGPPSWVVHRLRMGRGLRWPVAAFVVPSAIRRVYAETRFDLLESSFAPLHRPRSALCSVALRSGRAGRRPPPSSRSGLAEPVGSRGP